MPCPTSPILPVQEAHAQIHPFLPPERPIPKFISKKQATQKKSCNPRRLSSYAQRTSSPRKKNSPWANGFGRIGGRAGTTGAGAGITGKAGGVSTSGNAHSPTKNMYTYFEMNVFQVLPNFHIPPAFSFYIFCVFSLPGWCAGRHFLTPDPMDNNRRFPSPPPASDKSSNTDPCPCQHIPT